MQSISGIGDIEGRVQVLQAMKRSLKKLIDQFLNRGTLTECPFCVLTLPQTTNTESPR